MLQKEIEELKNIIIDFYKLTKIMIVIFDENFDLVFGYPTDNAPFCYKIRHSTLLKECDRCDQRAMLQCRQKMKSIVYNCHMGLTEAMTPIISNERIIGYILIGQILQENNKSIIYSNIRALPAQFDCLKNDLYNALEEMSVLSKDTLNAAIHIVNACASYIILNRFVLSKKNPLQYEMEKYIDDNIGSSNLSIQSICNHFHISRSLLYEMSKNAYGVGISDYIRHCRIEKAKKILSQSNMLVADVGRICGFNDACYFSRVFKQLTGYLPKEYASISKGLK